MVSFRFPFSFSQPPFPKPPLSTSSGGFSLSAVAVSFTVGVATAGAALNPKHPILQNALDWVFSSDRSSLLPWGSLSLADYSSETVVESRTGFSFPAVIGDSQRLLGVGLRKKSVLGLKNIDVYAFGVYADSDDIKKLLGEKYGKQSASELKEKDTLLDELMEANIRMTIRLQIVYGKLNIRSVRSAFQESVGSRLKKFLGTENKELLQSFTSLFKDEYKLPRGSIIDLSREPGNVLNTTIDGEHVGSVQNRALCQSILDLYIGEEEPFDKQARDDFLENVVSLLGK
ncbi:PREDICTED: fatty-acid-binding protein 1 [Tarenaya hassleriana]|uniref:fatty-acid-binding protein 1 n=1 Tax=Tarenaya hassleriana TaxID=28532 RepID=UPI00053CA387|nr:PREDICTED: fatty-acid-binding protein 1 [Tarenaya hassleriana]